MYSDVNVYEYNQVQHRAREEPPRAARDPHGGGQGLCQEVHDHRRQKPRHRRTGYEPQPVWEQVSSHIMHLLISFRKSTPPQTYQLIVYNY